MKDITSTIMPKCSMSKNWNEFIFWLWFELIVVDLLCSNRVY